MPDADFAALPAPRLQVTSAAAPVTLYVDGQGPPLLLVHSVNAAASAAEVRPLFEHYARRHTVYALDLPGFGLSARTPRDYTPRLMTDALHDALACIRERHGGASVDALALSLSCEFLARAAVERPDTLRSLALVSPTGFARGPRRPGRHGHLGMPWLLRLLRGAGSGQTVFRLLTRPGVIRYFLQRTWGSRRIDEGLWATAVRMARAPGAEHAPLHFIAGYLFSSDVEALYDALQLPTWLCHGVRGDFTDYSRTERLRGRPNWQLTELPTGALPQFEVLGEMTARYDAFLQTVQVR